MNKIKQHLEESGMNYIQHFLHSAKQSNRLIIIAVKSYLHGIFPWIFKTAGPLGVYKIYKEVRNLHHLQQVFKKHDETNQ